MKRRGDDGWQGPRIDGSWEMMSAGPREKDGDGGACVDRANKERGLQGLTWKLGNGSGHAC